MLERRSCKMSDEIRSEDEVEAHDPVGLERPGAPGPELEATIDEEPDFEAHGPVGLGPKRMSPLTDGPTGE
jgi:hypothetical protein